MSSSTKNFAILSESLNKKEQSTYKNQEREFKNIKNSLSEGQCFKALVLSCFALFDNQEKTDTAEDNNHSQENHKRRNSLF
jgi:hypothetical protein